MRIPTEDAYSSEHLVLSDFGNCKCSNVETTSPVLVLFPDFWVSNIPRSFCFLLDLHRIMSGFHGAFATGVACQQGNAYPSGNMVPSPFLGFAYAPIVETRFLKLAMSLLDFPPWIPLGAFSILHWQRFQIILWTFVELSLDLFYFLLWNVCNKIWSDIFLFLFKQTLVLHHIKYLTKRFSNPVFYADLVYKLIWARGFNNFIFSGTEIIKRLRHRQYDPGIIEKTTCLLY